MKEKPNEWISIADLMSGVVAVVMLLFIISILQGKLNEGKSKLEIKNLNKIHQEELSELNRRLDIYTENSNKYQNIEDKLIFSDKQKMELKSVLNDLKLILSTDKRSESLVVFNLEESKITLKDNIFSRGSACIKEFTKDPISLIGNTVEKFLTNFEGASVYIEGHTDNIPVSIPVIDFKKYCTVYDDNYILSAARAREARNVIISNLDPPLSAQVAVAGFGASHPIDGIPLSDAKNRRVEVRFILDAKLMSNL